MLVYADYRNVGLLRTDDRTTDYDAVSRALDGLPPWQRHDAMQVPLVHLARAPVDHKASDTGWAAHLVRDEGAPAPADDFVLTGSYCMLVRPPPLALFPVLSSQARVWSAD